MKKILLSFLIFLFILGCYILYILNGGGFFRTIDNVFQGAILKKICIPGTEDIAISYEDRFLIISSDDRKVKNLDKRSQGGLYFIDLELTNYTPKCISKNFKKPFHPHGISLLKIDSGHYQLLVINHVDNSHFVEKFDLIGDSLVHISSLTNKLMIHPNDIVAIDTSNFYFTNDRKYNSGFGKILEKYFAWACANIIYFDGTDFRVVSEGIAYANGINYDKERKLLFVAASRSFKLKVYDRYDNGNLNHVEDISCGSGIDNLDFDTNGNIWIGAHPNLLAFSSYANGNIKYAPSEILKLDYRGKNDYDIEQIYESKGEDMSALSIAIPYKDVIFTGNVMDSCFLILKRN